MKKWEYKLFDSKKLPAAVSGFFKPPSVTIEEAQDFLNSLGEEGWEVINVEFDFLIHQTGAFVGLAKREKKPEA